MIPYTSFLFFGITLYLIAIVIAAHLLRKNVRVRTLVGLTSLPMLFLQYWQNFEPFPGTSHAHEFWVVLGCAVLQWGIASGYLRHRRVGNSSVVFAASILATCSFLGFARIHALVFNERTSLFGFLGVSYLTFRALDVVIGIRDGVITAVAAPRYLAFLLFFPTISSGPIDRFRRFERDWMRVRSRAEFAADVDTFVQRIMRGFLYKFILAALIRTHWLLPAARGTSYVSLASYSYAYTFYLFFDFAGYSAFAIGFSYLLGIQAHENFKRPFFARNMREFWDRWHISLSTWLRDHVYMRFLMTATKQRWFRGKYTASYLGLLLTMETMGVWHGLAPQYLVYGIYHGILLVVVDVFSRWNKSHGLLRGKFGEVLAAFLTFHAVCFGLLIFSGRLFEGQR